MSTRAKAIVIAIVSVLALGVIAAVAVPTLYRSFFTTPAAEAPSLSADDSALATELTGDGTPLDPDALSGDWVVGAGSYAGYRVEEVLNGSPVTVTGRTDRVAGTMTLDGFTLTSADFTVDVASIATDNSQRDGYFRDQAVRANEHPTATFVLTSPVRVDEAPKSGAIIEQTLSGDLTIAGVTRPATFTAQVRSDGERTEIAGYIPIVFADFGITAPNLGFVSVEPQGQVEFSLTAAKA